MFEIGDIVRIREGSPLLRSLYRKDLFIITDLNWWPCGFAVQSMGPLDTDSKTYVRLAKLPLLIEEGRFNIRDFEKV